jgi:hypothetical protein
MIFPVNLSRPQTALHLDLKLSRGTETRNSIRSGGGGGGGQSVASVGVKRRCATSATGRVPYSKRLLHAIPS